MPPARTAAPQAAAHVVIADAAADSLGATLERAGLIAALQALPAEIPDVVVLVDMAGFDAANPGIAAARVDALIDAVCAARP
ncbi:MAG TPA: hypothetical protein PK808_06390, partial [Polymorphobacter sp.]|nr:hypothetical protein [Polymorphobacter sp.]